MDDTKGSFYLSKKCSKCLQVKPLSSYYRDRRNKDGYYAHCKDCHLKMLGYAKMGKDTIQKKQCGRCGSSKALSEFGVNKSTKSGRESYCKDCKAEYYQEKRKEERSNAKTTKTILKMNKTKSVEKCKVCDFSSISNYVFDDNSRSIVCEKDGHFVGFTINNKYNEINICKENK